MGGYLNNAQATEETFAGGWLHTGDLGYQDEDGFFFLVDRKKEMIIRGGYNVYPREVEDVLYGHPVVDEGRRGRDPRRPARRGGQGVRHP
jgi:long-chain acyl-CoA synthetase